MRKVTGAGGNHMKSALTTWDIARYCHVTPTTVSRWIKRGYLQAFTTPGGHHRILLHDFRAFLEHNRIPVDETLFSEAEPARSTPGHG
jgi:excisionase family DNA binding protein